MNRSIFSWAVWTILLAFSPAAMAQQINVTTPANSSGSSFFESIGTNFGFRLPAGTGSGSRVVGLLPGGQVIPNVTFSQNGFGSAIPAFGGFDPNAGLRFGFGSVGRGGGGFSLGFTLAQGSSRTSVSSAPSITIPNGGVGFITDGALRPFVTGVTPVVATDNAVTRGIASGHLRPYNPSKNQRTYDPNVSTTDNRVSSASVGAPSLAEIKNRKASQTNQQSDAFASFVEAARQAEKSGDWSAARVQILKALRHTDDTKQKRELKNWLQYLKRR